MFILIFPTRLKFSLLSFLVFRNLTTFWVENKMAKYLRMRQIPSMYYTPVGRSFFAFDGQGRPLGEGWNWFLFKYSAFWVEGHAGKHWWWVAAVFKISYNFYVLTIALKKLEEYMKCCLLSNVQVSKNSFSRVYCNSENERLFPFEIELPSVPDHEPINPLHPIISMCLLHTVFLNISCWADKENLVNNLQLF